MTGCSSRPLPEPPRAPPLRPCVHSSLSFQGQRLDTRGVHTPPPGRVGSEPRAGHTQAGEPTSVPRIRTRVFSPDSAAERASWPVACVRPASCWKGPSWSGASPGRSLA